MSEREDDTPETCPRDAAAPARGRYYYDDATGYEVYRPEAEEDGEEGSGDAPEGPRS